MFKTHQPTQIVSRNRALLAACILVVTLLGLASRKYTFLFPEMLGKYPGDALWSLMVYFVWAFCKPTITPYRIAIYALITSYLDELSQLIQVPWLNLIRHTTLGHLILGTGFSWYDMFFYTIGIVIGIILDIVIEAVANKKQSRV
jgi:hypothetical protein